MAQLGDTNILGDLNVTGRSSLKGNIIEINDSYDNLDPTAYNMAIGETLQIYCSSTSSNGSPWTTSTSSGYLMKTTSSIYTLVIYCSETTSTATGFHHTAIRTYDGSTWSTWSDVSPEGGSGGGGSSTQVEDYGIFCWDGKSSSDNSDNLTLWTNILTKAKTKTVLVYVIGANSATYIYKGIFIINSILVPTTAKTTTLYGLCYDASYSITSSLGGYTSSKKPIVSITTSDTSQTVSKVSAVSNASTMISYYYLPTNSNFVTSYTPTYDYHPATKKYVDDNIPDVFYWDGKSSDTNSDNLTLWTNILKKAKTKTVLVYTSNESSTSSGYKGIFVINPADVPTTATTRAFYGIVTDSIYNNNYSSGTFIEIRNLYVKITTSDTEQTVSGVSTLTTSYSATSKFLPTNNTTVTNFTPTYDYHPATKKYVDDNIPDLFYWDGKSSSDNSDNLTLWTNILKKAKIKTVLVYTSNESSTSSTCKGIFVINPADVPTTAKTTSFSGGVSYISYTSNSSFGTGIELRRVYVRIATSDTEQTVSGVSSVTSSSQSLPKYLPTDEEYITDFTPTYDYHPATKKYVDENAMVVTLNHTKALELGSTISNEASGIIDIFDCTTKDEFANKLFYMINKQRPAFAIIDMTTSEPTAAGTNKYQAMKTPLTSYALFNSALPYDSADVAQYYVILLSWSYQNIDYELSIDLSGGYDYMTGGLSKSYRLTTQTTSLTASLPTDLT